MYSLAYTCSQFTDSVYNMHTYLGDVSTGVMRAVAIEELVPQTRSLHSLFFRASMSP